MKKIFKLVSGNIVYPIVIASLLILIILLVNLSNTIEHLSKAMIKRTISKTEAELSSFFNPVNTNIKVAVERGKKGLYDSIKLQEFNKLFIPRIKNSSQISSMMYGNTNGNEFMLLQLPDKWMNRITISGSSKNLPTEVFWKTNEIGTDSLIAIRIKDKTYDPRVRPWFQGALSLQDEQYPHWTDPYTFFTTKDPGITVSAAWNDQDTPGLKKVIAFDVLLTDISKFTSHLEVTKNGMAFVLTKSMKILGLPKDVRFRNIDSLKKYVLLNSLDIGIPALNDALINWQIQKDESEYYSFKSNRNNWWGSIHRS